jgi:hypothetical protein
VQAGAVSLSTGILAAHALAEDGVTAIDRERMRSVAAFTAETLITDHPMASGADIVSTATGERLMRAVNCVGPDHDPSPNRLSNSFAGSFAEHFPPPAHNRNSEPMRNTTLSSNNNTGRS